MKYPSYLFLYKFPVGFKGSVVLKEILALSLSIFSFLASKSIISKDSLIKYSSSDLSISFIFLSSEKSAYIPSEGKPLSIRKKLFSKSKTNLGPNSSKNFLLSDDSGYLVGDPIIFCNSLPYWIYFSIC